VLFRSHWEAERPPSWWAMLFTLAADATLFLSLVFGALFLWLVAPGWPPGEVVLPAPVPVAGCVAVSVLAAIAGRKAVAVLRADGSPGLWLGLPALMHAATILLLALLAAPVPGPATRRHHAVTCALRRYAGLRAPLGFGYAGYCLRRQGGGDLSRRRSLDLRIAALWHDYTAVTASVALAVIVALPLLAVVPEA